MVTVLLRGTQDRRHSSRKAGGIVSESTAACLVSPLHSCHQALALPAAWTCSSPSFYSNFSFSVEWGWEGGPGGGRRAGQDQSFREDPEPQGGSLSSF